jgi:hypothetical protein
MKMTTVVNEWRKMCVSIPLKFGKTGELDAWVYGCFALHRVKTEGQYKWALTHIPTGRRLEAYPDAPTNEAYTTIAVQVHDKFGDAWNTNNIRKVQSMAIECKDVWQLAEVQA